MIPVAFSINYPAAACLFILACMGIYHLIMARKEEFDTTILPSSLNIQDGGQPMSIWTDKDIAVNCPLTLDQLHCRTLTIGSKGILQVREVVAEKILNHGILHVAGRIEAKDEITITQKVQALQLDSPRLILKKRAEAYIQVVSRGTHVIRSRKAHTRGFYHSFEEFEKAQRATPPTDAASLERRQRVLAATKVRMVRS